MFINLIKKLKSSRGNSLAEFAVVTAMMGTLASTAAPKFGGVGDGARGAVRRADPRPDRGRAGADQAEAFEAQPAVGLQAAVLGRRLRRVRQERRQGGGGGDHRRLRQGV